MSRRTIAIVTMVAGILGVAFALISTLDFAAHLDRQIHDLHCSFIPGASVATSGAEGCKAALFSSYSSFFREQYWGGIPISLFAVGAFAFFFAFGLYLLVADDAAPRRAYLFLGTAGFTPLLVSLGMASIALMELGKFCKVCVGLYFSSALLAVAAFFALRAMKKIVRAGEGTVAPREGGSMLLPALFAGLGIAALLPSLVYAASVPDYSSYIGKCGKLDQPKEAHNSLLKIPTTHPVRPVTLFEDPLCPTCKAFHERLVADGIFEKFDVTLVLFPLDDEDGHCNWMVGQALHPGACVLSRAVLCGGPKARSILEWSFANQEDLRVLGKTNPKGIKDRVAAQFGAETAACIDDPKTAQKLNHHLHFASNNHVPVSTPQVFLGDLRLCEEDTDLGLKYALSRLAPEVLR